MQFYKIPLKANIPYTLSASGRVFLIDTIDGATSVDVSLLDAGGSARQIMPGRKVLFKCVTDYSGVTLQAASDCTVGFFVSFDEVHNGYADGGNVSVPGGVKIINANAEPVPISFPGGVVNMTATNVGINNTDANPVPVKLHASDDTTAIPVKAEPLTTFVHQAAVSVGVAATALISDATIKKLIIRNAHDTATIALGGAGVTLTNGAIVLKPGDSWIEEAAAGAAWFAISDTAATSVQVMGVK